MTQPWVDYHGTEVQVDLVYKSAGVYVYLEVGEEFARLTPYEARELAEQLKAVADKAPGEENV